MARLYVANTTVQTRELHYRLVGANGVFKITIPPQSQAAIPKDLTSEEMAGVLEQQAVYGIVKAADVGTTRRFISAMYSQDRPVTQAQIDQARVRNAAILQEEGLKLRKAAALGVSEMMQESDPSSYLGARVSIVEKSDAPEVNEFHLHRQDGDYDQMGGLNEPIQAAPIKRGRGRPRRTAS